ncbi:HAD family hydrolase [Anaerorhabdus sp.]|uniref:HAD family hydrolase n=1 Tax=Anaerorhabdus sp. TaxID=1872524 RepID=UPI002FCBD04C
MTKTIIVYDFDGTLTPNSLPKIGLMDKLGYSFDRYEQKMKEWLLNHPGKDIYDSYYMTFLNILEESGYPLTDETFALSANENNYNPGVFEYFESVKPYVKNYLVSSGFKVPLLHSGVSKYFEEIYGTIFEYNNDNIATGVKYAMNDQRKVDKIKEICELNHLDNYDCSNVIYLGDGLTDAYAMSFVKEHGGISIFVYQPHENLDAFNVLKEKGIVDVAYVADYSINSELYNKLISIINRQD